MFFAPVSHFEVESAILSLKSGRSAGIDEISSFILKKIYKGFLDVLILLFNRSLSSGVFPKHFKTSKVIPIFKKGEKCDVSNYRPISLLSTLSKVLERIVYVRLLAHLNKNFILIPEQFGFRKDRSTSHAILDLLDGITCKLENREPALGVFCDLAKAFDRVDHAALCGKLEACGVRGIPLDWFRSYLTDRHQVVEVEGIRSDSLGTRYGVPQGSILGPLLFIIYVNDVVQSVPMAKLILYADDTTLLFGGPNQGLQDRVSRTVSSLLNWFSCNNLILNADKSSFMQFLPRNKDPFVLSLSSFGIKEVSSVKFLGLIFDSALSWADHIAQLCSRLSQTNFALRSLHPLLSREHMVMVYYGCFCSIMSYGVEAWGGSPHSFKVFLRQKAAIRIIMGFPPLTSCRGLFRSLQILTLPSLYIFRVVLYIHSKMNEIQTVGAQHRFPTRHGSALRTPQHRLTLSRKCAFSAGITFFNKLPNEIKSCNGKRFKAVLRGYLIEKEFYSVDEFLAVG